MYKDVNSVRVPETEVHREPRGAESAETAFGEVRLIVGAGKTVRYFQVSAHVFRVKENEGRLAIKLPEAKWNSVIDAFALFEARGLFVWEDRIYV